MLQEHIGAVRPPFDRQRLRVRIPDRENAGDCGGDVRPFTQTFARWDVVPRVGQRVVVAVLCSPDFKDLCGIATVCYLQRERHQILARLVKPDVAQITDRDTLRDHDRVVRQQVGRCRTAAALVHIAHEHGMRSLQIRRAVVAKQRLRVAVDAVEVQPQDVVELVVVLA